MEIDADAEAFATAFAEVMAEPIAAFGLVRIKRAPDRVGMPYSVGERFHGCFSLDRALPRWFGARFGRFLLKLLGGAAQWLEDRLFSDYAEVTRIERGPARWLGEYVYLDGTPIAGRSRFIVEPREGGGCRFTQLFEYQELNGLALSVVQRFASKYHDQVTHAQVHEAARRLGARVSRSTIPERYGMM
jgi:hypothetical protein